MDDIHKAQARMPSPRHLMGSGQRRFLPVIRSQPYTNYVLLAEDLEDGDQMQRSGTEVVLENRLPPTGLDISVLDDLLLERAERVQSFQGNPADPDDVVGSVLESREQVVNRPCCGSCAKWWCKVV